MRTTASVEPDADLALKRMIDGGEIPGPHIDVIRGALSHVRAVAEQLPKSDRWKTFLDYVVAKITRPLPPWLPPDRLAMHG